MKRDHPLIPPPQPLERAYLKHLLMRSAYLNRRERSKVSTIIVRARKSAHSRVASMADRWGVSQQVVMTAAMDLLAIVSDGVDLWGE